MSEKIGPFQVIANLGEGAHSSILHIRRNSDGRQYALKIVKIEDDEDIKYLDQAEHEYEIAQKLDHPNLIKIHVLEKAKAFGIFGGRVKEARQLIEFVNGKTLDQFKIFPLGILLQIFRDVAAGLVSMHRRGICHGDLKPNNIMLSKSGQVKVIDYGLAWIKGQDKQRIQGTPEYMAPEQVKKVVNEKTDIFNFGATMYRLLTWHYIPPVLLQGQNSVPLDEESWKRNFKPVLERNPKCPKALAQLVEHCVAYRSSHRPESMCAVHDELQLLVTKYVKTGDDQLATWEWVA
jgi:serine/threonine protein kinase